MTPAEIIRTARERAGLTQAELAAHIEMAQPNLSRLEAGRRDPSIRLLREILAACECELRVRVVRAKSI